MSHLLNCHQKTISSTKPTGSAQLPHNENVTLKSDVGKVRENWTKSYCLKEGQMLIANLKWKVCFTHNLLRLQVSLAEQRQMFNSFPRTILCQILLTSQQETRWLAFRCYQRAQTDRVKLTSCETQGHKSLPSTLPWVLSQSVETGTLG